MTPPGRILVTGASGFVAGHLIPRLRKTFPTSTLVLCGAGHTELDVTDGPAVRALVARVVPDACVHLAAVSAIPVARDGPARAWLVNLHGSLELGRAILDHAPGCTLLHVSSAEIYGSSLAAGELANERTPLAPINTYAATKAAADLALGAMVSDGLRVIRARPFNHTGPGQSANFVIPAFARQIARIAARKQPPVLTVGSLDTVRDFLDVRDVCDAYMACLGRARSLPDGSIFNVSSGIPRSIGDVLHQLLELAGVSAEIAPSTNLHRRIDVPMACGDSTLARERLAWAPSTSWDTTLKDVLADWTRRVETDYHDG